MITLITIGQIRVFTSVFKLKHAGPFLSETQLKKTFKKTCIQLLNVNLLKRDERRYEHNEHLPL